MSYEDELKRQLGLLGYQTTQHAGAPSPATRKFYPYHEGTDIGTPAGTPVTPQFQGTYLGSYMDNTGYGERAAVYNPKTGQTLYLSHLSGVNNLKPGSTFSPGTTIGWTGGVPGTYGAGNTTGAHLDVVSKGGMGQVSPSSVPQGYAQKLGTFMGYNPQQLLKQAQAKYGKNIRAISNDPNKLRQAIAKTGRGKIVRITV